MKRFFSTIIAIAIAALCITEAKAQTDDYYKIRIEGRYVNEVAQQFSGYTYLGEKSLVVNDSHHNPVHHLVIVSTERQEASSPDAADGCMVAWSYDRVAEQPAAARLYDNGLLRITVRDDEYIYIFNVKDLENYPATEE